MFRKAVALGAVAMVCAHNHPSGDPQPSAEDIRITKRLVEASKVLDIRILDHVIIGDPDAGYGTGHCSLRESNLVDFSD